MNNIILDKSKDFALHIILLYKKLCDEKKEYVLSKQLVRCGTSIGANTREAIYGESKNDFIHKLSIARKEANETIYWLELLHETDFIINEDFKRLHDDCTEILKILTAIIKSSKKL